MLSGLAAAIATGDDTDFDTGADRAETVYRYNLLEHELNTMMGQAEQDRVNAGLGDMEAKARVEAREQLGEAINNLTLDLLPGVGDVKGLVEAQDTIDYAIAAIAVIPGGDLLKGPLKAAKEALKVGDVETVNKLLEPIWSVTKSKTSVQNAYSHWKKHGAEFPDLKNAKQYVEGVRDFVKNPPSGTMVKVRSNGDKVYYDPSSNVFAVMTKEGVPKTMYKPDVSKHGCQTNVEYFNAQ